MLLINRMLSVLPDGVPFEAEASDELPPLSSVDSTIVVNMSVERLEVSSKMGGSQVDFLQWCNPARRNGRVSPASKSERPE